jgi:Holliday junction resolvasome RuvABC endonuclease subunit
MKILALDIATKTGWRTETSSGVWDLKVNRGESEGMRVVRFKAKVRELIDLEKIELISYERPAGQHKSSIMVASEMIGVLKDLCIEKGIEYASYSSSEIKKFATGKGNSGKPVMIHFAQKKHPEIHIIDDNHADAIHLYDLTIKDLNIVV